MRKRIIAVMCSISLMAVSLSGCTQADKVSSNLAQEADNFNVLREVTVINCIANDTLFQITGKMSIKADTNEHQLEIIVENEDGTYGKTIIGLADNLTYIVNDIKSNYVDKYKYEINYNPKMWIPPITFENID